MLDNELKYFLGGAPFIKNQEARVFATYSKQPLYTSFVFGIIKYT